MVADLNDGRIIGDPEVLLRKESRVLPDGPVYGHSIDEDKGELVREENGNALPANHGSFSSKMPVVENDSDKEVDACSQRSVKK